MIARSVVVSEHKLLVHGNDFLFSWIIRMFCCDTACDSRHTEQFITGKTRRRLSNMVSQLGPSYLVRCPR